MLCAFRIPFVIICNKEYKDAYNAKRKKIGVACLYAFGAVPKCKPDKNSARYKFYQPVYPERNDIEEAALVICDECKQQMHACKYVRYHSHIIRQVQQIGSYR